MAGDPGGLRNDFASTSTVRVFFFKAPRFGPASLRPLERRENPLGRSRAAWSTISLSFLRRVARQKRSGRLDIYTMCCARYCARRAAGSSFSIGCYINRIASAREPRPSFRERRRVIRLAKIIIFDDQTYSYRPLTN